MGDTLRPRKPPFSDGTEIGSRCDGVDDARESGPDVGRPVGAIAPEETVSAARHHRRIPVSYTHLDVYKRQS